VVVLSNAKSIFILAKFKMAENSTSVKELNVLKQICTPLHVSHSASSKKNLRPVLDWMTQKKKFLVSERTKSSINVGKVLQI
jgi:hypothetical protein